MMRSRLRWPISASARGSYPPRCDGEARRPAGRRQSEEKLELTTIWSGCHRAFPVTVFQGASVQNFDCSLACQADNAALLQIRDGSAHRLDRDREIIGDVIARDRQLHLLPGV